MKKAALILITSLVLLIILHISYLTVPEGSSAKTPASAVTIQQPLPSENKGMKKQTKSSDNKFLGWLKASVSFTLKGSDGQDYGLTFRWYK